MFWSESAMKFARTWPLIDVLGLYWISITHKEAPHFTILPEKSTFLSNACKRCFPSVLGIIAKFPCRKSSSILPYFRGRNSTKLHLRCVIVHKTLFSPSFLCENIVTGMPYFHGENPVEFRVWCAMVYR